MARQIANNSGFRVVFMQEGAAAPAAEGEEAKAPGPQVMGHFDQGSNTLYINSDAAPEAQAIFGLMHEVLHGMSKSDPRGVQGLFDRVESVFGKRFADYAEAVAATYKGVGVTDESTITEEGFVNFLTQSMYGYMAAALTDANEMRAMAFADPGMFRDVISTFGSWAKSLTGKDGLVSFDRDAAEAVAYTVDQYNRASDMEGAATPGAAGTALSDFRFAQDAIESIQKMLGDRGARMEVARREVADIKSSNLASSETHMMAELADRLGVSIPEAVQIYEQTLAGGRTALTERELMVAAEDRLTPVGELIEQQVQDWVPPMTAEDMDAVPPPSPEEQARAAAEQQRQAQEQAARREALAATVAVANELGSKTGYDPIEILQGDVTPLLRKNSSLSDAEKQALTRARDEWSRAATEMKVGEDAEAVAARAAEIRAFDQTKLQERLRIENETALERLERLRNEAATKAQNEAAARDQAAQAKLAAQEQARVKAEQDKAAKQSEREAVKKTKVEQEKIAKAKSVFDSAMEAHRVAERRLRAAETANNEARFPDLRSKFNETAQAVRDAAKAYAAADSTWEVPSIPNVIDFAKMGRLTDLGKEAEPQAEAPAPAATPPAAQTPPAAKPNAAKPKAGKPGSKPSGTTPESAKESISKPVQQSQSTLPFELAAKAQENLQLSETLRRFAQMPADQLDQIVAGAPTDLADLVGKSHDERVAWLNKKADELAAASQRDQGKYSLFVKINEARSSYTPTTPKSAPMKAMMDFIGSAFDGQLAFNRTTKIVTDKASGGKVRTIAKMMREKLGPENAINWRAAAKAGWNSSKYLDAVDVSSDRMVDVVRAAIHEFPMWQSWYRERLNVAMNIFKDMDPSMELPENQFAMKLFLAVTSNGEEVQGQTDKSYQLYLLYRQYGSFQAALANASFEFNRESAMDTAFALIDSMVATKGWEAVNNFLLKSGAVQDLRSELVSEWGFTKKQAEKATKGELADEVVPYGLVFGPKIGSFFNNLSGQFDTTTMDRWFMRTFGRTMGMQLERKPGKIKDVSAKIKLAESRVSAEDLASLYKAAGVTKSTPVRDRAVAISKYFSKKEARVGWDSKEKNDPKSDVRRAYNSFVKIMDGFELIEAPKNGTHRRYIRNVMAETIRKMDERYQWTATPAELQALLWYYEKEVHEELGSGETEDPDYGTAAQRTYEKATYDSRQKNWLAGFTKVQGPQGANAEPSRAARIAPVPPADAPSYVPSGLISRRARTRRSGEQGGTDNAGKKRQKKESASYRSVSPLEQFASAKQQGPEGVAYALRVEQDGFLVKPQQLLEGAQLLKDGQLTRQQYESLVDRYRPITPYDSVPVPASVDDMRNALIETKRGKLLEASRTLKSGHPVALRLDIPAYKDHGVWVVTTHEQGSGFAPGSVIGYEAYAAVKNASFGMNQQAALNIAAGKPKTSFATIKGEWMRMSSKAAYKAAQDAMRDGAWAQVGMDPWRHGYFYDRSTREPIVSASEVIQVGPLVLAKNPVYAPKKNFAYALRVDQGKGPTPDEADAYNAAYANKDKKAAKAIKDRVARRLGLWKGFHGTPSGRFNAFDVTRRGGVTGANSAKNAFFASSKVKVAETYQDLGTEDFTKEELQYFETKHRYARNVVKELFDRVKDGNVSIIRTQPFNEDEGGGDVEAPWKIVSSYSKKWYSDIESQFGYTMDTNLENTIDSLLYKVFDDWTSKYMLRKTEANATEWNKAVGSDDYGLFTNSNSGRMVAVLAQFEDEKSAKEFLGGLEARLAAVDEEAVKQHAFHANRLTAGVHGGSMLNLWVKMSNPRIVQGGGPGVYNEIKFNAEVKKAIEDGNDGVIFKNVDDSAGRQEIYSDIYAFFKPEQSKFQDVWELDDAGELIPLDKQFDFTKQDMRYALRVPYFASGIDRTDPLNFTTIDSPSAGWFVKQFVDYMQPVRAVAKTIEQVAKETGGRLAKWSEEMDVSAKLDMYRNLTAKYMTEGQKFIDESAAALAEGNIPLTREAGDAAGNANVSAEEYLIAKHAQRRNEVLLRDTLMQNAAYATAAAARNTTEMDAIRSRMIAANPRIQSLSGMTTAEAQAILAKSKSPSYERLSKAMRQIQRRKLELGVTYGLMSKAQADAWQNKYGPDYVPLKTTILDPNEQYLGGSGFVIRGPESKAAKGRATLADDILGHAVTDYSAMVARGMKNMVGNAFYKMAVENPNAAWTAYESRDDVPTERVSRLFVTKINGEEKIMTINNAEMVRAMRNMDMADMGRGLAFASMASRMFTKLQTAWNPAFIGPNFVRDLGLALTLTGVDESTGAAWRVAKNIPAAVATIFAEQFNRGAGSLDREYRELQQQGGLTGYAQYYSVTDAAKALELEAGRLRNGTSMPVQYLKGLAGVMEKLNAVAERATRLAVYKEARDRGLSQMKAAEVAVNITVNFSRRGNATPVMNTLYPFFNASIQGVDNLSKRMFWSERSTPRQKRRMMAAIAGISTLGYIFSAIARGAGGDDEDGENAYKQVPEYDLSKNMIIMAPDGTGNRAVLPLPWGLSLAYFAGVQAERMAAGDEDEREAAGRLLKATIENISPINGATWSQAIAPTLVDPIVQIAENQNFAGAKIMPDRNPYDKTPLPDSQLKFKTVNPVASWAAETMNDMTGGSARRPGVVDVSPESIEHLAKFAGGGAGSYIYGIGNGLAKMFADQEMTIEEAPAVGDIVGRFVTVEDADRKTKTEFFDNMRKYAMFREDLLDPETRGEARRSKLRSLDKYTTSVDAQLRDLRERQKSAKTEESAKVIEQRMLAIMRRYNQRYNRFDQ
jgi:hypothetical protein